MFPLKRSQCISVLSGRIKVIASEPGTEGTRICVCVLSSDVNIPQCVCVCVGCLFRTTTMPALNLCSETPGSYHLQ